MNIVMTALTRWRAAESHWEQLDQGAEADVRSAALEVVAAWLAYQEVADTFEGDALLVADATGTFVAANAAAGVLLGCPVPAIPGRTVADITAPTSEPQRAAMWSQFLADGVMRGSYTLRAPQGVVTADYQARAHYPIPGYFTSRLRRTTAE